ncbi:EF-hand domain-containing protein [Streptomyces sp. NPDC059740]|uniref:EF-hand domain-containing protein n=1 Tax=Streptomyces sp. NPDC059740 TaxID=3346926 RepID=UPI003649865D
MADIEAAKLTFARFDANKDGRVTADEFRSAMAEMGDLTVTGPVAEAVIAAKDSNKDGEWSFEFFCTPYNPTKHCPGKPPARPPPPSGGGGHAPFHGSDTLRAGHRLLAARAVRPVLTRRPRCVPARSAGQKRSEPRAAPRRARSVPAAPTGLTPGRPRCHHRRREGGVPARGAPCDTRSRRFRGGQKQRQGEHSPRHSQLIARRGACRKAPVRAHNRRPAPRPAQTGTRCVGCGRPGDVWHRTGAICGAVVVPGAESEGARRPTERSGRPAGERGNQG